MLTDWHNFGSHAYSQRFAGKNRVSLDEFEDWLQSGQRVLDQARAEMAALHSRITLTLVDSIVPIGGGRFGRVLQAEHKAVELRDPETGHVQWLAWDQTPRNAWVRECETVRDVASVLGYTCPIDFKMNRLLHGEFKGQTVCKVLRNPALRLPPKPPCLV